MEHELIDVVKDTPRERVISEVIKPFEISGVYLLTRDGSDIFHKEVPVHSELEADIFSSMFRAVKAYIKDPPHSYGHLRNVCFGGYKVLVESGEDFFIVVIGKGDYIQPLKEDMKRIVDDLKRKYGESISYGGKDTEVFQGIGREFNGLSSSFRCKWAVMNGDQPIIIFAKGETMMKHSGNVKNNDEEIQIPLDSIRKIDDLIRSGATLFTSREDFVKCAVEIKLKELRNQGPD
jgi:hypothetical protein